MLIFSSVSLRPCDSRVTPSQALRQIVRYYAEFAVIHYDLVRITMADACNLPDPEWEVMVQMLRDHIDEWTHLLR